MDIHNIFEAMRAAANNNDSEIAHFDADNFLMELVQSLADMMSDEEVRNAVNEAVYLYNRVVKCYV